MRTLAYIAGGVVFLALVVGFAVIMFSPGGNVDLLEVRSTATALPDAITKREYHVGSPKVGLDAAYAANDQEYLYLCVDTSPSLRRLFLTDAAGQLGAIYLFTAAESVDEPTPDSAEWEISVTTVQHNAGSLFGGRSVSYKVAPSTPGEPRFDPGESIWVEAEEGRLDDDTKERLTAFDRKGFVLAVPLSVIESVPGDVVGIMVAEHGGHAKEPPRGFATLQLK